MSDSTLQQLEKPSHTPEYRLSDAYQFVHSTTNHVLSHNDRAGDGEDRTNLVGLAGTLLVLGRHFMRGRRVDGVDRIRGGSVGSIVGAAGGGGRVGERWQMSWSGR